MITCPHCGELFEQSTGVGCVCANYGYSGHEWTVWCCQGCMENSHPDIDLPDEDEP